MTANVCFQYHVIGLHVAQHNAKTISSWTQRKQTNTRSYTFSNAFKDVFCVIRLNK